MTITISIQAWMLFAVIAWVIIGLTIALRYAISTQSMIVLLIAWPIFVVLAALAPIINWWVNREFRRIKRQSN